MEILLENLMDTDWDNHWEQNLELGEVNIIDSQEGMAMEKSRAHDWEKHWEK